MESLEDPGPRKLAPDTAVVPVSGARVESIVELDGTGGTGGLGSP